MPSAKACFTTAGLLLSLAAPTIGCGGGLPPVQHAPASPTPLTVLIDPNVTVGIVRNDQGLDVKPMLHDALATGLTKAGYQVVTNGSADLTLHLTLAKVGYAKYGSAPQVWAEGLDVEVSGADHPLAHENRQTVNWSDREGASTEERLAFTARVLVNALSTDPNVARYAKSHPTAAPPPVAEVAASPAVAATPAPGAPAASGPAMTPSPAAPVTGGYAPVPAPAATP